MLRSCCSCLSRQPAPPPPLASRLVVLRPSPLGSSTAPRHAAALSTLSRPSDHTRRLPKPPSPLPAVSRTQRRGVCDQQHFRTRHGNIRVNLVRILSRGPFGAHKLTRSSSQAAKGAVGIAQSRGERPYVSLLQLFPALVPPQLRSLHPLTCKSGTKKTPIPFTRSPSRSRRSSGTSSTID